MAIRFPSLDSYFTPALYEKINQWRQTANSPFKSELATRVATVFGGIFAAASDSVYHAGSAVIDFFASVIKTTAGKLFKFEEKMENVGFKEAAMHVHRVAICIISAFVTPVVGLYNPDVAKNLNMYLGVLPQERQSNISNSENIPQGDNEPIPLEEVLGN